MKRFLWKNQNKFVFTCRIKRKMLHLSVKRNQTITNTTRQMKTIKNTLSLLIVMVVALLSLSSCSEDAQIGLELEGT